MQNSHRARKPGRAGTGVGEEEGTREERKGGKNHLKIGEENRTYRFFSSICHWKININYVHELNGCLSPIFTETAMGKNIGAQTNGDSEYVHAVYR